MSNILRKSKTIFLNLIMNKNFHLYLLWNLIFLKQNTYLKNAESLEKTHIAGKMLPLAEMDQIVHTNLTYIIMF